jgi:phosphoribosylanthranilate isomerase
VDKEKAMELGQNLDPNIKAVGVFVDEEPEKIADLVKDNVIDIVQLHGSEDEEYIRKLRSLTDARIIKAFQIKNSFDSQSKEPTPTDSDQTVTEITRQISNINNSSADMVLIDSGQGTGTAFNWQILKQITRPYFLAGGINLDNVDEAVNVIKPYAIDVSSGIETDGIKDEVKMRKIIGAVKYE